MITADEITEYVENGVVKLSGIFDLGWIEYLRDAVETAMADPGPFAEEYAKGEGRFFGDLDVAKRHVPFRDFIHNSRLRKLPAPSWARTRQIFSMTSYW